MLSPIFVWGALWAPGGWDGRTTLGFLLVHLALYPGANAFNTAFDRDEGPIGGLGCPPPVPRGLAAGSVALQAAGAALAPLVGAPFALAYLALWAVFTAYSHPRTRWKRSVPGSAAAIVVGQGGLGFWLGWAAAGGGWPPGRPGWLALLAAAAVVAALYPWTQAYQVEADAARDERTLAAALGARGTLLWMAAGLGTAGAALAGLGVGGMAGYALGATALALVAAAAAPPGWSPSHRLVMRTAALNSTIFLAWTIASLR